MDRLYREVVATLGDSVPEAMTIAICRQTIESAKDAQTSLELPELLIEALKRLATQRAQALRPAINATGVLLHTGLGRARLAPAAARAVAEAAQSHAVVEIRTEDGKRGDRTEAVRAHLCALTGAEDAFVVNNCAAAVLLALAAVAGGQDVILSRGQMVEIGGSYRMPEIVQASGCQLVEVGCTNKTHLRDYQMARTDRTGAILRCHRSNFAMSGFVAEPAPNELATWAKEVGLPVIDDLGSGCLVDTTAYGLPKERTLQEALSDGADLVLTSGDKMLGGPQAGLIVGSTKWVQACKKHPMARAMRMDKLGLAGLEATLALYREEKASEIPFWRYAARISEELKQMAERLQAAIGAPSEVRSSKSLVGGGSLPEADLPSWSVVIPANLGSPDLIARELRLSAPAVFASVREDAVWMDVRTLDEDELELVAALTCQAVRKVNGS